MPSHAELDAAMDSLNQTLDVLDMGEFPHTDKNYGYVTSTGSGGISAALIYDLRHNKFCLNWAEIKEKNISDKPHIKGLLT